MTGKQSWSEIYYSDLIDNNIIALTTPIQKRGSTDVLGTLNILIDQNEMDEIVHSGIARIGESGDAYLVDINGLLLTNTRLGSYQEDAAMVETINTYATRELASAISNGDTSFQLNGVYKDYLENEVLGSSGIVLLGDTYAGLVIEIDEAEAMAGYYAMRNAMILILAIAVLGGLGLALYLAYSISKPITHTIKQSENIANLDISTNISPMLLNRKDEVGDLANALQKITDSLRDIISLIAASSEEVSASSEELTATSQQSASSAEEVAKTVEEIATGASNQAQNTQEGSQLAISLGETVAKDQAYVKELNENSEKVKNAVEEGLKEIDHLTTISSDSSQATKEVHEGIIRTNESAKKIGEASNVIATIAEQTNLLALNAAIEAARAGEAGKGFSVVADEIRKLAEQSTTSTKTIDQIVQELQKNATAAVEIMEKVSAILIEQNRSIDETKSKYVSINKSMEASEQSVDKLNISGDEMSKMKDKIIDTLQELSAIVEENSASTEEVTAAMEEQAASIEDISSTSEALSGLAQKLQEVISKFKI
ncbi:methyl-accepting chemotaxis protein [Evansella tamaricis]|uniref:HAMP domain-containing protein n=1 Tax=Evansella tamaricis TaxID=2069301 RepID=A0ABS6JE43_9BACI|nr:HAMP domain-containing methyl-accepting chemotaxis protein [Evansella tamaricis]MBU9711943.1 HAMP domain-containing protein [Evansella tamaricis]